MPKPYLNPAPSVEEIESVKGTCLLEFGTDWCSYCQAAASIIEDAIKLSGINHLKIEDGKGMRLGRRYKVKLWPTLILLKDGREVSRLVRPESTEAIKLAINSVD